MRCASAKDSLGPGMISVSRWRCAHVELCGALTDVMKGSKENSRSKYLAELSVRM